MEKYKTVHQIRRIKLLHFISSALRRISSIRASVAKLNGFSADALMELIQRGGSFGNSPHITDLKFMKELQMVCKAQRIFLRKTDAATHTQRRRHQQPFLWCSVEGILFTYPVLKGKADDRREQTTQSTFPLWIREKSIQTSNMTTTFKRERINQPTSFGEILFNRYIVFYISVFTPDKRMKMFSVKKRENLIFGFIFGSFFFPILLLEIVFSVKKEDKIRTSLFSLTI